MNYTDFTGMIIESSPNGRMITAIFSSVNYWNSARIISYINQPQLPHNTQVTKVGFDLPTAYLLTDYVNYVFLGDTRYIMGIIEEYYIYSTHSAT